jgi:predicted PurR-regulated permease PerM
MTEPKSEPGSSQVEPNGGDVPLPGVPERRQPDSGRELLEPYAKADGGRDDEIARGRGGRRSEAGSAALTILALLAIVYTLYFARGLLIPIVVAVLLSFVMMPGVRAMQRVGIPTGVGAGILVLALYGSLIYGVVALGAPAQRWAAAAPETMAAVSEKFGSLRRPVEELGRIAEQVGAAAGIRREEPEVVVRGPSLGARVLGTTRTFLTSFFAIGILLYFLLAAGDLFLQKVIKVTPHFEDKKKALQIGRALEHSVSGYLLSVVAFNGTFGIITGLAMWAVGLPNPFLWGALAFGMDFLPYIGAVIMIVILAMVGATTFDTVGMALLPALVYFVINFIQGNFLYPIVVGRRMTLNPVAVFIGVAFWWTLWGLPGAFVAVPMMATLKLFADQLEGLGPVGEFLGK